MCDKFNAKLAHTLAFYIELENGVGNNHVFVMRGMNKTETGDK